MIFFFFEPAPSDISPPVASPSLVAVCGFGAEELILESSFGFTDILTIDDFL